MTVTDAQMSALRVVVQRWPVDLPCGCEPVSTVDCVGGMYRDGAPCDECGDGGRGTGTRPATAEDLAKARADGWPMEGMAAWWEKYGFRLSFDAGRTPGALAKGPGYPVCMGDWCGGLTVHAAMVAAAVAMVDGENKGPVAP